MGPLRGPPPDDTMTDWPTILLSGVIGGVLGTAVTAMFTWRSTWTSYAEAATKHALEVDQLFIRHPELRLYFYDGIPLPDDGSSDCARALAAREFVADGLEGIADNRDIYSRGDWDSWLVYIEEMLKTSPTLKQLIDESPDWYPSLCAARSHQPRRHFGRTRKFWRDLI